MKQEVATMRVQEFRDFADRRHIVGSLISVSIAASRRARSKLAARRFCEPQPKHDAPGNTKESCADESDTPGSHGSEHRNTHRFKSAEEPLDPASKQKCES